MLMEYGQRVWNRNYTLTGGPTGAEIRIAILWTTDSNGFWSNPPKPNKIGGREQNREVPGSSLIMTIILPMRMLKNWKA